jgi:hypothetical protein
MGRTVEKSSKIGLIWPNTGDMAACQGLCPVILLNSGCNRYPIGRLRQTRICTMAGRSRVVRLRLKPAD